MNKKLNIDNYFDYAATTPCDESVLEDMSSYWSESFGNPHSRSHKFGWDAEAAIENARSEIANLIKANSKEIIFTSGATEANNLAIQGFVKGPSYNHKKICCLETDHKCVVETLRGIAREKKIEIEFLPVDSNGLINYDYLMQKIKEISLISIAYVNNETGVIQDLNRLSRICRENGVFLHLDAAQAFGKISLDSDLADLISISGHKIYGPKGIGALFISKRRNRVRIRPILFGGGQENGIRSGTLSPPLCVGLGKAASLCGQKIEADYSKMQALHDYFLKEIQFLIEDININGSIDSKSPYIINLSIPCVEGESLMMRLSDFALASGSACTSKTLEPSYVIAAMHPEDKDLAHSSLRISFGRYSNFDSLKKLIDALVFHIKDLRKLSPLWSMSKKGIDLKQIQWKK